MNHAAVPLCRAVLKKQSTVVPSETPSAHYRLFGLSDSSYAVNGLPSDSRFSLLTAVCGIGAGGVHPCAAGCVSHYRLVECSTGVTGLSTTSRTRWPGQTDRRKSAKSTKKRGQKVSSPRALRRPKKSQWLLMMWLCAVGLLYSSDAEVGKSAPPARACTDMNGP